MSFRCTPPFCTHGTNRQVALQSRRRWRRPLFVVFVLMLGAAGYARLSLTDLQLVGQLHQAAGDHLAQGDLLALLQQGQPVAAFQLAFAHGDEMFETTFNAVDGVGANVGDGQRFSRLPRADQVRPGEWATHVPPRTTGPNAASCNACHDRPGDDGAGGNQGNAIRDPFHTANPARMIQRNTPHLFGAGAVQRLAEEMTVALAAIKDDLEAGVRRTGVPATAPLVTKGVDFGVLRALPPSFFSTRIRFDWSGVDGVDRDLVVKPFQWKGTVAFLRAFNRDAGHNELGMQATELVGDGNDGDDDQVVDELSVGDLTAFSVYIAAQPRPTTRRELSALGLIAPLPQPAIDAVVRGETVFAQIGCTECHRPSLEIDEPVFREPSPVAAFRDARFPSFSSPIAEGVRPDFPVHFDLTRDQPDNVVVVGGQTVRLGSLPTRADGTGAVVRLYGDLRRHRMGAQLAESIDETGSGASTFLTENLWGVGTTAPYLHDGRATTLTEAILAHGGEAGTARHAFVALANASQRDLLAFLDDLVLFKAP